MKSQEVSLRRKKKSVAGLKHMQATAALHGNFQCSMLVLAGTEIPLEEAKTGSHSFDVL